jgi:ornithine cyclodeaminase/alanine dehydrogenase-like protein (mu-crystallin family)
MRFLSAEAVDAALDFPALVDALAAGFRGGALAAPPRHHHVIPVAGAPDATQLLMPAWGEGLLGIKIVNAFPGNGALGLPAVHGVYVLQDGATGAPLAIIDGTRLTLWRTAAVSALGARYLARADARRLTMIGAGALAPFLARAHAAVRPIREIVVWNHRPEGARALAARLAQEGFAARAEEDLEAAVKGADVVSAATLSTAPLIRGAWLKPGQHVDLVGAFNMSMREADDLALQRSRVFVDTPAGLSEGGDVARAIASGALPKSAVIADLAALAKGAPGRGGDGELTVFKSVGASIEDLATAMLIWRRAPPA